MGRGRVRILVVEDEPRYVRAIRVNLEGSGYEVLAAPDGSTAVDMVANEDPDLVLLDIRMPGMDGYEACRRIREFSPVPIIMLTAMAETADKVRGLGSGADDYITKPFSAEELLARVQAVLRRAGGGQQTEGRATFEVGELRVDFAGQRVFVRGQEVHLTPTEYRLLGELAHHAGQVLVPEVLLEKVWGMGYAGETRLVWQAIHRLRQKIEPEPRHPRYIQTRAGIGYMLTPPG
jgi:DNA-binding response OmpR family regulator